MYKPESILENEILEIHRNVGIQMDHLNLARRPNLVIINKKRELAIQWTLPSWQTTEGK